MKMKKNVIVVMFDSLQFNYLGCYGNNWIKTPNMDRLAREGVLFENNYCENQPTVPCRRSMLTGRYSVHSHGWQAIEKEDVVIADMCWGQPVDTALIFDCPMYRLPKFGWTRGFDKVWFLHGHELDHEFYAEDPLIHLNPLDYFEDHIVKNGDKILGYPVVQPLINEVADYLKQRQYWKTDEDQNVAKVMKKAVRYLEEDVDPNKQFFLWIDCFDPHEPWDSPSVYDPDMKCPYNPDYNGKDQFLPIMGPVEGLYTEEELHHIRMLYAENVTMCDKWLGYLMDKVRKMGLEENTLFILVSDHGEPMGNGEHGHGIMRKCRPWPYEELVHTPFIIRGPNLPAGKRISAFTQSCDVAPTIAEWLGLPENPMFTGKSVLPLATGKTDKLRDFAIAGYFQYAWTIHTEDWSYVHWRKDMTKEDAPHLGQAVGAQMDKDTVDMMTRGRENALAEGFKPDEKLQKLLDQATVDGEEMWTCTPGSKAEVPQHDELYDRKADPFQLNNIADKHPGKAEELYNLLREFMAELRTS